MKIFGKTIHRSLVIATTLAATAFGSLALTAPAQARDSFSFGYSDGWNGFSLGVNDHRGYDRWDRHDRRWDRRDWDRRDYWRHRDYPRGYYYRERYRYVAPPPYYYAPQPYYYGYGY